jgi:hypothetical protein
VHGSISLNNGKIVANSIKSTEKSIITMGSSIMEVSGSWTVRGSIKIGPRASVTITEDLIATPGPAFQSFSVDVSGLYSRLAVGGTLRSTSLVAIDKNATLIASAMHFAGQYSGLMMEGGTVSLVDGAQSAIFTNGASLSGRGTIIGGTLFLSNGSLIQPCEDVDITCVVAPMGLDIQANLYFGPSSTLHVHIYWDSRQDRVTAKQISIDPSAYVVLEPQDTPIGKGSVQMTPLEAMSLIGQFAGISASIGSVANINYASTGLSFLWQSQPPTVPTAPPPVEAPIAAPELAPELPPELPPVRPPRNWSPRSSDIPPHEDAPHKDAPHSAIHIEPLPSWAIGIISTCAVLLVLLFAFVVWRHFCRKSAANSYSSRGSGKRSAKHRFADQSSVEARPLLSYDGDLGETIRAYLRDSEVPIVDPAEIDVIETVGSGSTGVVLVGKWHATDELVAVKQISTAVLTGEGWTEARGSAVKELVQEMQIMTQLSHPNLLPLLGCCVISDSDVRFSVPHTFKFAKCS